MKQKSLFFLAVLALLLVGCSSTVMLVSPQELDGQSVRYIHELKRDVIHSDAELGIIALAETSVVKQGEKIGIVLVATNLSETEIQVNPEIDISVADNLGNSLHVYSREQLIAEHVSDYKGQKTALALQAFGNALGGGQSTSSHQGTINGQPYSGTSTTQDLEAKAREQSRISAQSANLDAGLESGINRINSSTLRTSSIPPGGQHGGILWFDPSKSNPTPSFVDIKLSAAGEVHQFRFVLTVVE